jgi:hypothetical protein
VDFIGEHRESSGSSRSVPCCPSTAARSPRPPTTTICRRPSKLALRDAEIVAVMIAERDRQKLIRRFGARKMWLHLRSTGHDVARCTIERLYAQQGWAGAVRAKT